MQVAKPLLASHYITDHHEHEHDNEGETKTSCSMYYDHNSHLVASTTLQWSGGGDNNTHQASDLTREPTPRWLFHFVYHRSLYGIMSLPFMSGKQDKNRVESFTILENPTARSKDRALKHPKYLFDERLLWSGIRQDFITSTPDQTTT